MKKDTFEKLFYKCQDENFLKSQNIGKEIPFYIIPYDPKERNSVVKNIHLTIKRLKEVNRDVLLIDFFALCIELLKEDGMLEDVFVLEQEESGKYFLDAFDAALNNEVIANAIHQKIVSQNPDVVFVNGVGEIYPFKRIHPLINTMHSKTANKPIIFFYPGVYDGNSFKLFGLNNSNGGELFRSNYYRAYNLE